MAHVDQHVHIEWRGETCRVKWWSGEYLPNGRKRYESKGGFTDEDEAFRHGQDKLYEIRHGTHVSNRDKATLMGVWLDDWLKAMDYAYSTEAAYRSRIETHIRPYFGQKAIGDIDTLMYRKFKTHIQQTVAPTTAKNVLSTLGMILDDAVPRLIKTSPVERTKGRGKFTKKAKERKRDVSEETVEALARNARVLLGEPGYVMIWTMATTGMRPGELFGLTREYCYPQWPASDLRLDPDEADRYDEDLERYGKGGDLMPAIRVERQAQRTKRVKGAEFFPPKYGSNRTLVIPPFLADMLEAMLASHASPWVFPAYRGGCLAAGDFNGDYWYEIRDGADERPKGPGVRIPRPAIPSVSAFQGRRMYLLRHSHKAWLDEELEHSRYAIEARMGHEMGGVEGTYSSVTVPMERAIMKTMQRRWDDFQNRMSKQGDS